MQLITGYNVRKRKATQVNSGAENNYTTIRKTTLISDNSLLSEHDSETEDKWVPHDIDSDIADDSSSNIDVTLNTSLNSANDVNQEDKWEPQTTEKGLSSKSDIQTVDNGRSFSTESDIQTDKIVLSEQDGKQELGNTDISIENAPPSKKDIHADKNVQGFSSNKGIYRQTKMLSEHDGKQDHGDTDIHIENEVTVSNQAQATQVGPTDIKKIFTRKTSEGWTLRKLKEYIKQVLNIYRQYPFLSEDDVWFIDQIKTTMAPFCLVRRLKAVMNSGTIIATIRTAFLSQVDVFVPVIGSAVAGATTFST
ncbi:unnamed protein product [Mytilus edulis]|uniref:Uncharacterized protein n=1 Tax=Mytilus edulis TaxID=6550 RepID=A0A8S3SXI1_MYTED|nr:unnamed protein product [Mytilus edulis]